MCKCHTSSRRRAKRRPRSLSQTSSQSHLQTRHDVRVQSHRYKVTRMEKQIKETAALLYKFRKPNHPKAQSLFK
uniref:Uncharacterized protein n=1 Tax=Anguilla anguilla TaxID=7936 RepID=A0A0E9T8H7_ANGAN